MKARILTAVALIGAAVVCVFALPSWLAAAAFAIPWTLGAWEWARLVPGSTRFAYAYAMTFIVLALGSGSLFTSAGAEQVAVAATSWWLLALVGVTRYPWRIPALVVSAGGFLALLPGWFLLAYVHQSGASGPALAMSVLVVVWAADVGAFFCGRWLGRVKLAPRVSPGKTWEGVGGGLLGAAIAASLAAVWLRQPWLVWVVTGLAAALVSIVGDLTVSVFKRRAGRKDSSDLLPGHGGVLDRIDSLTAAMPVFVLSLDLAGLLR